MKEIYLLQKAITEFNHEEFAVYVALKRYIDIYLKTEKNGNIIAHINIDSLIYELTGSMKCTRDFKDKIKKGLDSLIAREFITVIEQNKDSYFLELTQLYITDVDTNHYFVTTDEEIWRISNIDTKQKLDFFHYAMTFLSSIWTTKKWGCSSIDDLCEKSKITKPTAISYNGLLEQNKIVYIARDKFANRYEDGTVHYQANTYGRYEDKEVVIQVNQNHKKQSFDVTKNVSSDEKRSIKALYNSFVDGTYTGDVKELYDKVLKYNDDSRIKTNDKQLDISVFPFGIASMKTVTMESVKAMEKLEEIKANAKERKKLLEPEQQKVVQDNTDEFPWGDVDIFKETAKSYNTVDYDRYTQKGTYNFDDDSFPF